MATAAQSCCAFQTMSGDQMASARAQPVQSQGLRNIGRRPPRIRPAPSPTTRNATLNLFMRATPVTAPTASHKRSFPVRSSRTTSSVIADQNEMSNAVVESK